MANNTIAENIRKAINDFNSIEMALQEKGKDTTNIPTSQYSTLIEELSDGITVPAKIFIQGTQPEGYDGIWIADDTYKKYSIVEVENLSSTVANSINIIKGHRCTTNLIENNLDLKYSFYSVKITNNNNELLNVNVYYGNGIQWDLIPEDYTELEYIQATGTQWIDTGYKPSNNTNLKYHGVYEGLGNSPYIGCIFGVSKNSNLLAAMGYDNDMQQKPSIYYNQLTNKKAIKYNLTNNDLKIKLENGIFTIDIEDIQVVEDLGLSTGFNLDYNLTLFCYNSNNVKGYTSKGKLYSFQIIEGDTIIRDYIPVKDLQNVVCLYDKISRKFVYNSGTGNFIAGNEI